jgi:hypothetical protein
MLLTSVNARAVYDEFNQADTQHFIKRLGADAARDYYKSEFVHKVADFVRLFNEIDGEYSLDAVAELAIKVQFLAIRADAYAVAANNITADEQ